MKCGQGFKAPMILSMAGPRGISNGLARETGVSQATLSRWLKSARTVDVMSTDKSGKWTPADKLRVINEASQFDTKEPGTFLRKGDSTKPLCVNGKPQQPQACLHQRNRPAQGRAPKRSRSKSLSANSEGRRRPWPKWRPSSRSKKSPRDLGGARTAIRQGGTSRE